MSARSRLARVVARDIIQGWQRIDREYGYAPAPATREDFRTWVSLVQRCWGRPREWRKGRRSMRRRGRGLR